MVASFLVWAEHSWNSTTGTSWWGSTQRITQSNPKSIPEPSFYNYPKCNTCKCNYAQKNNHEYHKVFNPTRLHVHRYVNKLRVLFHVQGQTNVLSDHHKSESFRSANLCKKKYALNSFVWLNHLLQCGINFVVIIQLQQVLTMKIFWFTVGISLHLEEQPTLMIACTQVRPSFDEQLEDLLLNLWLYPTVSSLWMVSITLSRWVKHVASFPHNLLCLISIIQIKWARRNTSA